MFNKDALVSLIETHLIVSDATDTRSGHSVARARPSRPNSILGLASFCAKGNDYPQPMHMCYWRPIKLRQQDSRRLIRLEGAGASFQSPIEIVNIPFGRHVPSRTYSLFRESPLTIRESLTRILRIHSRVSDIARERERERERERGGGGRRLCAMTSGSRFV